MTYSIYTRYLCTSSGNSKVKLAVGTTHTPADILVAALTQLASVHMNKVAVKTWKNGKLDWLL